MTEMTINDYVTNLPLGVSVKLSADYLSVSQARVHSLLKEGVLKWARLLGNRADYKMVDAGSLRSYYTRTHGTETQYQKLKAFVETAARKGRYVEYNKAMALCNLDHALSLHRTVIGRLLGRLSRESLDERDVMLSAIVVLKNSDMPSNSFFVFARELEIPGALKPREDFHKAHVKRVFAAYKK